MQMNKTLIIKLAALGDVLRTTPLLHRLDGKITWVTKKSAFPLIKSDSIGRLIDIDDAVKILQLKKENFDAVISLDEDIQSTKFASEVRTKKLIGAYFKDGKPVYTPESSGWFDMSLISKYGVEKANELKWKNKLSYQEHIFRMMNLDFRGEEYILSQKPKEIFANIVGIEKRAGGVWPAKRWFGYDSLAEKLEKDGATVKILGQREHLEDYIADINCCSTLVCGDTLAMHIALALKKHVIGLFTCTSVTEIFDYGRLTKIVNPNLENCFYTRKTEINKTIPVNLVYDAVRRCR